MKRKKKSGRGFEETMVKYFPNLMKSSRKLDELWVE
jgi:hypothetical protein